MLNIFNRIPKLGVAIAEYLANENSSYESLASSIKEAIDGGENPLTMDLMMLSFLIKIPEELESLRPALESMLEKRKNILGSNSQMSDEFIAGMCFLTYDMNHNNEVIAERYSNLMELAKNAPECVRNSAMRTIMNSIVLTGKYRDSEYRDILMEAISYAKEIESESEVYFEGARCNFWNL